MTRRAAPHFGLSPQAAAAICALLRVSAALFLFHGGFLCLEMHVAAEAPPSVLAAMLGDAVVVASLFRLSIAFDTEPRSTVSAPPSTGREAWETLPGDIVEGMLGAIALMTMAPAVWVVWLALVEGRFTSTGAWHAALALAVAGAAFALRLGWNKWRGRTQHDPPGWTKDGRPSDAATPSSRRASENRQLPAKSSSPATGPAGDWRMP